MSTKRSACDDHDVSNSTTVKKKYMRSTESKGDEMNHGNGDYSVGWICAITSEYVAAQTFLDATHGPPDSSQPNDNNIYTLGEIGKHNVVIAVLPKGGYGTTSAASVARDMLRTFPNIRIGLMVGIGGGAPSSQHDIRLGDIVVSTPHNREGGVFQYDFGKAIQDEEFKVTGHVNQPPIILGSAVSRLEAQYEMHGHRLEYAINRALEEKSRLKRKYKRPNLDTDKLYRSEVTHPANDDEAKCTDVCGDDPTKLVPRTARTQDDDDPAIHYGIVASANQLMKNALLRDKIAKENSILCFEMEAAGLMNHFPCLVIRGICDYSDTHKNKEWQGYAAMAAAAYAKDLLSGIPVHNLEAESRISDIISSVGRNVDETRRDVKSLVLKQRQAELYRWLSPPDPSINYNKARQQHQEGTGSWFLQSDPFTAWKSRNTSFLWLYGIPGCGKTILSSTIVDHLQSLSMQHLLYFYFDFTDAEKQTLRGVISSLISQLYHACKSAQKPLNSLFSSNAYQNTQASCENLCKILHQMIKLAEEVWIVLDAVDECAERKSGPMKGLMSWMRDLIKANNNIHFLVTSRPEEYIRAELSSITSEKNRIPIQSILVNDDILAYIYAKVRKGKGLKRWWGHQDIQEEIEETLARKAGGMFRWVACQIDALEDCLDYITLRSVLDSLPETLDETYARMINSIPVNQKLNALRILQFLVFSERPLRIEEAVDAIAVKTDTNPYFSPKNRMPEPVEITRCCSSLVVMVSVKKDSSKYNRGHTELRLAHYSVKEYLISNRLDESIGQYFHETAARASITRVCLAYLLHFDQDLSWEQVQTGFPFAKYCATYWMSHAQAARCKTYVFLDLVKRLFCYQMSSYRICYTLYRPDGGYGVSHWQEVEIPPPLYYAAFGGFTDVVRLLLDKNADVNAQGGFYHNALYAASFKGHKSVVELLLSKDVDVNAKCGDYNNALQVASYNGYVAIVELLLKKNANVNAQGGLYYNALYAASFEGHESVVELLLSKEVDVNVQCGEYNNALQMSSYKGYVAIVELLLNKNADVNAQGGFYGNALQAASYRGHEAIVKLLLNKKANVNAKGGFYANALYAASEAGYETIVSLLLDNNADVNAKGGFYDNALYAASFKGHETIVRLLLNRNADGDALYAASEGGHQAIVKLLLDKNASHRSESYGKEIYVAFIGGHKGVVKLLRDASATARSRLLSQPNCSQTN